MRNGVVTAKPEMHLDLGRMGRNKSVGRILVSESGAVKLDSDDGLLGKNSETFYIDKKKKKRAIIQEPSFMTNSKRSSALESNAAISGARSAKPAPRKKPDRMLSPSEKVAKHATAFAEHSTRLARLEYLQALKKMQLANLGYGNHPEV